MDPFFCQCGSRVFFENTVCLNCGSSLAWCEACRTLVSLRQTNEGYGCQHCGQSVVLCHNYAVEQVCNRAIPRQQARKNTLCHACQLTETIPDLSVKGNREKWGRLEQAKRRLLYQLDYLEVPYIDTDPPLGFDFKSDLPSENSLCRRDGTLEQVSTGHASGKITINIKEADDVEREKLRVDFDESHRTLIGHFRHEIGHFYWEVLVRDRDEEAFLANFGNHFDPGYDIALQNYYANGPVSHWKESYVSAYATAHPWEDFAETFGLYLDLVSVLVTASNFGLPVTPFNRQAPIEALVTEYQHLGVIVNELNRCLGILDLVPEVIVMPVIAKLDYIHLLLDRYRSGVLPRATPKKPST